MHLLMILVMHFEALTRLSVLEHTGYNYDQKHHICAAITITHLLKFSKVFVVTFNDVVRQTVPHK